MQSNKMKKALINKKGVHILRHTFARNLVAKNINLSTISEVEKLMGGDFSGRVSR
jgi:site-specific recombinase XerD